MKPEVRIEWLDGPADLDSVQEIDRASFGSPWTRAMYEQELQHAGQAFIAVLRAGSTRVAAYCSYRLVVDEIQINNVAVRPESRRRGYGRALIGGNTAILEVRRSNDAARRLYAQAGFVQAAERPRYYANPEEDAVVMVKDVRNLEEDPVA